MNYLRGEVRRMSASANLSHPRHNEGVAIFNPDQACGPPSPSRWRQGAARQRFALQDKRANRKKGRGVNAD
jgi:hypothetical protein